MLVHEQNRIPGMTNRLLTRFARKVLQGFPGTFPQEIAAIDSGNPVRQEVAAIAEPQIRLQDRSGPIRVLITGGSQGAQVLNQVVPMALQVLPSSVAVEIRHQAGAKRVDEALASLCRCGCGG